MNDRKRSDLFTTSFSRKSYKFRSQFERIPAGLKIIQVMLLKYNNHQKNGFNFYVIKFCKNINTQK